MFGLKPQLCCFMAPVSLCFLLLTCSDAGQSQVIGPTEPITVTFGDDITLPCHLEPAMDVGSMTFEWSRRDLTPRFVHVWHQGQEPVINQHPSYRGRTSLFISELKHGDVSLKLSAVKISDNGTYRCFIPEMKSQTNIELIVGAVSSPGISFSGLDTGRGAVVLQCESTGWFPEPELLWLDSEGKLLSAGPTQTVRRPDDLYTVSSTVTVEQRHSNSFTCRVQQKNINQTRETRTHVPDDFFLPPPNCAASITSSVVLCLMLFIAVAFFVWKRRQNKIKIKLQEENEEREKKTAEHQLLSEREKEQTHLTKMTDFLKKLEKELEEHKKKLTTAEEKAERVAKETEEKNNSVEKEVEEKGNKADAYFKVKEILTSITWDLNERKKEYQQPKSNTEKLIEMTHDEMNRITEEKKREETHMKEIRQSEDTERQGDETQVTLT